MNKRDKVKWLKALRSGKFKQGNGSLKGRNYDGDQVFCCLGVLKEVCPSYKKMRGQAYLDADLAKGSSFKFPEPRFVKFIADPCQVKLAHFNDEGVPFTRIARWIERYL